MTNLCHKSITQAPSVEEGLEKSKEEAVRVTAVRVTAQTRDGGGKEQKTFSRSIWSFGGHHIFFFTTQIYMCGEKKSSRKTKT